MVFLGKERSMLLIDLEDKLAEAKHFFLKMDREQENRTPLRFNFSAFLSSSRCVFQYGHEIFKSLRLLTLYDNWINAHPITGFFKEKRNINIHESPVYPQLQINVKAYETIGITDSIRVVLKDQNGNIKDSYQRNEQNTKELPTPHPTTTTFSYFLEHWSGPEDMFEACQSYLEEIQEFIVFISKYKREA